MKKVGRWGLQVSIPKTKGMVVGEGLQESDRLPVPVEGGSLEVVDSFTYLGASITSDGEISDEVAFRIGKACGAFGCLKRANFSEWCTLSCHQEGSVPGCGPICPPVWCRDLDSEG